MTHLLSYSTAVLPVAMAVLLLMSTRRANVILRTMRKGQATETMPDIPREFFWAYFYAVFGGDESLVGIQPSSVRQRSRRHRQAASASLGGALSCFSLQLLLPGLADLSGRSWVDTAIGYGFFAPVLLGALAPWIVVLVMRFVVVSCVRYPGSLRICERLKHLGPSVGDGLRMVLWGGFLPETSGPWLGWGKDNQAVAASRDDPLVSSFLRQFTRALVLAGLIAASGPLVAAIAVVVALAVSRGH